MSYYFNVWFYSLIVKFYCFNCCICAYTLPLLDLIRLLDSLSLTISCDNNANLSKYSSLFFSNSFLLTKKIHLFTLTWKISSHSVSLCKSISHLFALRIKILSSPFIIVINGASLLTLVSLFIIIWKMYIATFFTSPGWKCRISLNSSMLPHTSPSTVQSPFICELPCCIDKNVHISSVSYFICTYIDFKFIGPFYIYLL